MKLSALSMALITCNRQGNQAEFLVEGKPQRPIDSLFFGIRLGMRDHDFYKQCFEMNQRGVFRQSGGTQVQCVLRAGFSNEVIFRFFPLFENSNIQCVKGYFMYANWAPYQPQYAASKLRQELIITFTKWYGGNLFVQSPSEQSELLDIHTYTKVDINRKITVQETADGRRVEVLFEMMKNEK